MTNKLNVDPTQFFELSQDSRTRGHHMKLKKNRFTHVARNKFFSNRVVTPWNSLPDGVVMARSTNALKNQLDLHQATTT